MTRWRAGRSLGIVTSPDGGGFAGHDPQSDGSAEGGRRNAAARGPAPHDDDPVRLAAPVDPWLTGASTSVLGDAPSSPEPGSLPDAGQAPYAGPPPSSGPLPDSDPAPYADTSPGSGTMPFADVPPGSGTMPYAEAPPLADTAPFVGAGYLAAESPHASSSSGWADGPPPRRRGRRAARWAVAVLAACALFVAGMLAVDLFGLDDDGDASGLQPPAGVSAGPTRTATGQGQTPAANLPAAPVGGASTDVTTGQQPGATTGGQPGSSTAAAAPETSADADALEVVYEVTASGSRNVGSVSYTDQDGDIIRRSGIPLPWRITFQAGGQRRPLVLIAQRKGGGDAGPVTCTITLGGKLLSSTTAEGRYAAPQCSGSGA
jgi:hypothetical protein